MTPEELQPVKLAYDVQAREWVRVMELDPSPRWLAELRSRLVGVEYVNSGSDEIEAWRMGWVQVVTSRMLELGMDGAFPELDIPIPDALPE